MTTITNDLLENLLHMTESATLDFKQAPYPIANATDEQKGEFVKDVLAFANAWKASDAYIVVGVQQNPGTRATIVGVPDHPDDATLQQLVNLKTNVPVDFSYIPVVVDEKDVGVIRVAQSQNRPIFLRKKFGRLGANEVYIRRGSSTVVAAPDEIARIGAAAAGLDRQPALAVELCDPVEREPKGASVNVVSRRLVPRPPPSKEEQEAIDLARRMVPNPRDFLVPSVTPEALFRPSKSALDAYRKELALLSRLGFRVTNTGTVLLEDLRIVIEVPKQDGLRILDERPEKPVGQLDIQHISLGREPDAIGTHVHDRGGYWELFVRIGKIQPSAVAWSDPFWIGSTETTRLSWTAKVFADNISRQVTCACSIEIEAMDAWLEDAEPAECST